RCPTTWRLPCTAGCPVAPRGKLRRGHGHQQNRASAIYSQANRSSNHFRRPSGDRDRECPAIRGEQQRTRELSESLEQQTATSEVLTIISRSPAELEPVFEAILTNATRLCDAKFGTLNLYDGEVVHRSASYNVPPEYAEMRLRMGRWRPHPGSASAQVARPNEPVHFDDL